jgi:acyl-CoA thioester hydrolase
VNNAVYLNYLEYARYEFLNSAGITLKAFREMGFGLIVTRVCIDYKRQAVEGDLLDIITVPIKKNKASGVFRHTVTNNEKVIAEAEVTWGCIDSKMRPARIPAGLDIPELEP